VNVLDLGLSQKSGTKWLRPTGGFIIAAAFFFQQFTPVVDAISSTGESNRSVESRHLPPTTWSSSLSGTTAYARLFLSPIQRAGISADPVGPITPAMSGSTNSAEEVRQLSGLPVDALADLVRVTRTSFHDWLRGRPITLQHERDLLQTLAVLRIAARTNRTAGVRRWLLEPVGGKTTPFDLLRARDYDTALGLALRVQPASRAMSRSALDQQVEAASGVAFNMTRRVSPRGLLAAAKPSYKAARALDRGWKDMEWPGTEEPRRYSEHTA
jgi:hypothetical protein